MSNYEFWDELGKIFNAVVAYQEKSVEFNKRFINPWIRLGNVFDKQDRNREAVAAYQKAIEIDPANAQNWCDLGSAYFRTEAYDQAIHAFQKAIELDPKLGWPYSNLALVYVTQDNHEQAIFLYQKSIELLEDNKDKAVSWNRLGNLYRKLNEYDLAVEAFQQADQLDHENAGFRDTLDEVPAAPSLINEVIGQAEELGLSPLQLIVEQSQVEEAQAVEEPTSVLAEPQATAEALESTIETLEPASQEPVEAPAGVAAESEIVTAAVLDEPVEIETVTDLNVVQTEDQMGRLTDELLAEAPLAEAPVAEAPIVESNLQAEVEVPQASIEQAEEISPELAAEAQVESPELAIEAQPDVVEQAPVSVQVVVETFTENIISMNTATETTDVALVEEPAVPEAVVVEEVVPVVAVAEAVVAAEETPSTSPATETVPAPEASVVVDVVEPETDAELAPVEEPAIEAPAESVAEQPSEPVSEAIIEVAFEEQAVPAEPVVEAITETVAGEQAAPVEPVVEAIAEATEEQVATAESVVDPVMESVTEPVIEAPSEAVSDTSSEPAAEQPVEAVSENDTAATVAEVAEGGEVPQHEAYEEFLKDDGEALNVLTVTTEDEAQPAEQASTPAEPITKLDESGELQIEMDTKNAHVWNELGNVYFNNGAVDDSIIAYSKAIELDRYFAWPYSNLALAYVQKGRFPEAVLLYERSIELFTGEKDKAISWNRLGNVYRRLNDYEHAIEAYQRADELDPDNTTLSLQSRFSLLGSYQMEQNASYAA